MSGTASIGRRRAEWTPSAINSRLATSTTGRFASDQWTMADSRLTSLLLAERATQHGALERESALHHDQLALAQAGEHLNLAEVGLTQADFMQLEVAVRLAHEDERLARDLGHGRARRHQHGLALLGAAGDMGRAEQTQAQQVAGVVESNPRGHGARDGVDLASHVFDRAREAALGEGVELHLGRCARMHVVEILLEHPSQEPDLGEIGDLRYRVLRADG